MALAEQFVPSDEIHPIDIAQTIATHRDWDFDRLADDQLALSFDGQWRSYSLTLAWSTAEEVLRLVCTFDFAPPNDRLGDLYEVLNLANDEVWDGSFAFWAPQQLMVWRYGLVLAGEAMAEPEQLDRMICAAVTQCERFYPAFQLACWGRGSPASALDIAMTSSYGRA